MDGNFGGAENHLLLLITYTKIQGKLGNLGYKIPEKGWIFTSML